MPTYPFFLVLEVALAASGTGTVSYTVSKQERLEISRLLHESTGIFNVTDIRNSNGLHYTNASALEELPGAMLADVTDDYNAIGEFPIPLVVAGGETIYIDLEDSSGAGNTVTIVAVCTREYP